MAAVQSQYYAELSIDASKTAAGPGRLPFDVEVADLLSEFRPPVVSFHFGLPSADLLATSSQRGREDTLIREPLWAGQNTSGCREIPAAVLTRELAALLAT
jgi:nitronate monooxygenase